MIYQSASLFTQNTFDIFLRIRCHDGKLNAFRFQLSQHRIYAIEQLHLFNSLAHKFSRMSRDGGQLPQGQPDLRDDFAHAPTTQSFQIVCGEWRKSKAFRRHFRGFQEQRERICQRSIEIKDNQLIS